MARRQRPARERRMHISVVICTWNRADELRTTLDSLTQLVIPPGCTWELIVVNNGCTDETNAVIAEFEARLPIRSLFEGELGLSRARNRRAAAAQGDLILFTDDDVTVEAGWLEAYPPEAPEGSSVLGSAQPRGKAGRGRRRPEVSTHTGDQRHPALRLGDPRSGARSPLRGRARRDGA